MKLINLSIPRHQETIVNKSIVHIPVLKDNLIVTVLRNGNTLYQEEAQC